MEQDIPLDLLIKKGKKPANFDQMTPEEYQKWERSMQKEAEAYLFSIGQPLVYKKDGEYIAEHADGNISILK
jgi:hypothetical protein